MFSKTLSIARGDGSGEQTDDLRVARLDPLELVPLEVLARRRVLGEEVRALGDQLGAPAPFSCF